MAKKSFRSYLLNRINTYSIIFFISTLFIMIIMTFLINNEIKTAIDEQLDFIIRKSLINYDLVVTNIEDDLNSILKEELENVDSFNQNNYQKIKSNILSKSKYSNYIENIHYFEISKNGVIKKTSYEDDLNLDLSTIEILWDKLTKLKNGEIEIEPLANEKGTTSPWLYAYKKISENKYIELGIDFKDEFNVILFDSLNQFVKESRTVKSIEIYTPYFIDFLSEKTLSQNEKEIFKNINNSEIKYLKNGFYKYKSFLKINSEYGSRYIIFQLDYVNARNIFITMIILAGIMPIILFLITRLYVLKQTKKVVKPINEIAKNMENYNENYSSEYIPEISETEITEIDQIKNNFLLMTKRIKDYINEQETINSELEELYENNEILIKKINRLIKLTVDSREFDNLEDFLKYIFDNIFDFIPEADYGSLSVIRKSKRHFIDTRGHNLEILEKIDLKDGLFVEEKEIKIIEDILEYDKTSIPKKAANLFIEASKPIKSTLIIPFHANGKIYGNMNLDIDKSSDKKFNQESIRFSKFFSELITSYIIITEFQTLDSKYKEDMIKSIINLVELHDNYTKGHSNNVSKLAIEFSKLLNLDDDKQYQIFWAALIHDMGKIVIPSEILNKPTKLTNEEFDEIKKHPIYAYEVLKDIDTMKDIAKYIRHHHERIDGRGYPDQLKGDEIPYESKIICICDAWDAMTSSRSYKRPLSKEEAKNEIMRNKGLQFDEELADKFLKFIVND